MFTVDWTQHAVGHGGFHTGRAQVDDALDFNWIFDCGAKKTAIFDAFLKAWTLQNQQPIDWLFISHFDTDHVSGLDTLMSRAVVRDVMVPYVNERELVLQLLHEIDRGNLDRAFFELVADPAAFFLGRGAERVTFFRGRRRDGEPTADGPRPERPRDQKGWVRKITPAPRDLPAPQGFRTRPGQPSRVQVIDDECDMAVVHGPVGLRLKPHRAPIAVHAHKGLMGALQALVGPIPWKSTRPGLGDLAFAIAHHARTATGRAALRKLFKAYVGSSNRSSLSLLSTPYVQDETYAHWGRSGPLAPHWDDGVPAWMNTGDAELLDPADLNDWDDTYAHELAKVRVLALPHHGSDKNSDGALQALCPGAVLVAHVKAGSAKHPGLDVAAFAGERLACVTNQAGAEVRMHFWLP
jgi:hypothetical protein